MHNTQINRDLSDIYEDDGDSSDSAFESNSSIDLKVTPKSHVLTTSEIIEQSEIKEVSGSKKEGDGKKDEKVKSQGQKGEKEQVEQKGSAKGALVTEPMEIKLQSVEAKNESVLKIVDHWCSNFFESSLRCINNSFRDGKFDESALLRLQVFLGPEKYWLHFQVRQKLHNLSWEKLKLAARLSFWQGISANLTQCLEGKEEKLAHAKIIKLFSDVNFRNWSQKEQSTFEQKDLPQRAAELLVDYDALMVRERFIKPLARYYQIYLDNIKNEELFNNGAIKKFKESGDIEQFTKAIQKICRSYQEKIVEIGNEASAELKLVDKDALAKIDQDYQKFALDFIEKDLKTDLNRRTSYYGGATSKGLVQELTQTFASTGSYLEVKQSKCTDDLGNTLLHYALKKYRSLTTEEDKEEFLRVVELLYRHGAIAHTKNYLSESAYIYAEIDSSEWRILPGWKLGLLEIEATFVYSEVENGVKTILCEYSRDSKGCVGKGFIAWIIGIFKDWHNLKSSVRSRDLNEVLRATLTDSLLQLDDDILTQVIVEQQSRTVRGDKSQLFGRLIDEVITPLRQSKLFALKHEDLDLLESYRAKIVLTEQRLQLLESKNRKLSRRSNALEEKMVSMERDFSTRMSVEFAKLRGQLGLSESDDEDLNESTTHVGVNSLCVTRPVVISQLQLTGKNFGNKANSPHFFPTVSASPKDPSVLVSVMDEKESGKQNGGEEVSLVSVPNNGTTAIISGSKAHQ